MGGPPTVIVCALEFERRRLARSVGGRAEIVRSGPGPHAVAACVDRLAARGVGRAILAGVGGGLRPTEVCPAIGRVVDRAGRSWTPTLTPAPDTHTATLLGVDQPVTESEDKAALAIAHDADLVDCESHAFAERAEGHSIAWAIVRGVSDGPADRLDPRVLGWIDGRGATRMRAVLLDLMRHPRLIGAAARLGRRSAGAMDRVAARVDEILYALERVPDG